MKKVAYCIFGSQIHGAEKRVIKLALLADKKSNNHISQILIINKKLLISAKKDSELRGLIINNSECIKIINEPPKLLRRFTKIWFFIATAFYLFSNNSSYIHAYLGARNLVMPLGFLSFKIIYEITSPDGVDSFIKSFTKRLFLYNRLFRINCVSESVYMKLNVRISELTIGHIQFRDKIVWMDQPFTSVSNVSNLRNREKLNVVICACRFVERKNVIKCAEMFRDISSEFPNWKFKMFGTGPLENELKIILDSNLRNGSAYIGYTDSIVKEFSNSKIAVSLIGPDNFPSQSLFEAMAMGNAIFVSDVGLSNRFIGNKNGVLSKKGNHKSDLINLMKNEKVLERMMDNSLVYYNGHFSEKAYYSELVTKCYT